jgi:hypothetical protein
MRQIELVACLSVLVVLGCTNSLRGPSSGQIGCPPDQITISNDRVGWDRTTWKAECNGRAYYCTRVSSGNKGETQTNCTEENSAPASKPVTGGGCGTDAECKGDRICVDGACVNP